MWLSKRNMRYTSYSQANEIGTVTLSRAEGMDAGGAAQTKDISVYSPYGYSFLAPKGEEMLLVSSALGTVGSGTRMKRDGLLPGEIAITSLGGARIELKNNGDVVINGYVIPKNEGEN